MSIKKLKDSHVAEITNDISESEHNLLNYDWQHTEVNSDKDDNGDDNVGGMQVNSHVRIDSDW